MRGWFDHLRIVFLFAAVVISNIFVKDEIMYKLI